MSQTKTRIWVFTTLVRINTGPPTWWKPDVGAEVSGRVLIIRLGWLRMAVQIGIGLRRAQEEEGS